MNSFKSFFVNSYPRSGNTWIRLVLTEALNAKPIDLNPVFSTRYRIFPVHWYSKITDADSRGCIFKSHLMFDQLPQDLTAFKGIYMLRDGRDSLLSYYFFNVKHKGYTESWDSFFERYFKNRKASSYRERILLKQMGSWGENVSSYDGLQSTMLIRYEDLLANTQGQLQKAFDFLGINFHEYKSKIQEGLLRSNESLHQKSNRDREERKRGANGAWKDFFSREQNQLFIDRYGTLLNKFGYLEGTVPKNQAGK